MLLKMLDVLKDNDDVQNVYANFNIPEAVMSRLSARQATPIKSGEQRAAPRPDRVLRSDRLGDTGPAGSAGQIGG